MGESSDTKNGTSGVAAGVQGLKDIMERTFLAGMGAAALTKDRIQDLIEEVVSKGQMNAEEGREVVERLVARSREEAKSVLKKADSSLQGAYREIGLGSKRDLEELVLRVEQLEHRVQLLEEQVDSGDRAKS